MEYVGPTTEETTCLGFYYGTLSVKNTVTKHKITTELVDCYKTDSEANAKLVSVLRNCAYICLPKSSVN